MQVAAAVFAVRGTRLTKTGTVQADIQLLRDRDAELYYAQRALKHVQKHIRRLSAEQPDVQWGFFITGQHTCCVMGMSPLSEEALQWEQEVHVLVALTSPPLGFHTYPPGHALIVQSRRRGSTGWQLSSI